MYEPAHSQESLDYRKPGLHVVTKLTAADLYGEVTKVVDRTTKNLTEPRCLMTEAIRITTRGEDLAIYIFPPPAFRWRGTQNRTTESP